MNQKLLGILCVIASIVTETIGQVNLKKSTLIRHPIKKRIVMVFGLTLMLIEVFIWNYVMQILDLSIAYPLSSFGLIVITLMSKFYLKEQVCLRRWVGIFCVLFGGIIVGSS